jgi:hypothetical protein
MPRFIHRVGVAARFCDQDFGEVCELDVGEYDDPTQLGAQCYTFSTEFRQDVVRFVGPPVSRPLAGVLGALELRAEGAEYRVEAVCTRATDRPGSRVAYEFEAQASPQIKASARERHGVDCLGTALLLDELAEED